MKDTQYYQIDFLASIVEQCPDNYMVELQCNWTSTAFSDNDIAELKYQSINSIKYCKTSRKVEVFKCSRLDRYKYKRTKFGQFPIWDGGLNLLIKADNKNELIKRITKYLDNSDVCHCQIYTEDKHIGKCYDNFMYCWLDSSIFKFTTELKENFADNDIDIYFDNEG